MNLTLFSIVMSFMVQGTTITVEPASSYFGREGRTLFTVGGRYWAAYGSASMLLVESSADAVTWGGAADVVLAGVTTGAVSVSGYAVHFVAVDEMSNTVFCRRGVFAEGALYWNASTVAFAGTSYVRNANIGHDAEGFPWIVFNHHEADGYHVYAARALDSFGERWDVPTDISGTTGAYNPGLSIHRIGGGQMLALWTANAASAVGNALQARRFSSGSWKPVETVDPDIRGGESTWSDYFRAAVDLSGDVHVVYVDSGNDGVRYRFYDSNNEEWSAPEIVSTDLWAHSATVTVDAARKAHVFWNDDNSTVAYSTNEDGTWAPPSAPFGQTMLPLSYVNSADHDGNGVILVSYRDLNEARVGILTGVAPTTPEMALGLGGPHADGDDKGFSSRMCAAGLSLSPFSVGLAVLTLTSLVLVWMIVRHRA